MTRNDLFLRRMRALIAFGLVLATAGLSACGSDDGRTDAKGVHQQSIAPTDTSHASRAADQAYYQLPAKSKDQPGPSVQVPLEKTADGFAAAQSLVLPTIVPTDAVLGVAIGDDDLKLDGAFTVQGTILDGAGKPIRSVAESAFSVTQDQEGNAVRIELPIKDLRALMSDTSHTQASVSVLIHQDNSSDPKHITFKIETPPSEIGSKVYVPVSKYEQEKNTRVADTYRRLRFPNGDSLDLIGIIELVNSDTIQGYDVNVPFVFRHDLNLIRNQRTALPVECGYRLSDSVSASKQDSTMRLVVLRQNIDEILTASASQGSYSIALGRQGMVKVGLYSTSPKALSVPAPIMFPQRVPSRCIGHCIEGGEGDWADGGKWGDDCVNCGRSAGNTGESCYRCMRGHSPWCRWQRWESWLDYTGVSVGSTFQLELVPTAASVASELSLSYRHQQVPPRKLRVFTETITIKE